MGRGLLTTSEQQERGRVKGKIILDLTKWMDTRQTAYKMAALAVLAIAILLLTTSKPLSRQEDNLSAGERINGLLVRHSTLPLKSWESSFRSATCHNLQREENRRSIMEIDEGLMGGQSDSLKPILVVG
ncbi:hypothetical protein RRG08_061898 [Elysia crispata]|uniref:Uncharacterized protein n=1 Tax=Elysia crispata TaxID=231223 RepID=A0AAE1CIV6_9GAST|nr:hypothetical protein RRG08_061898 [Elysia crispata]